MEIGVIATLFIAPYWFDFQLLLNTWLLHGMFVPFISKHSERSLARRRGDGGKGTGGGGKSGSGGSTGAGRPSPISSSGPSKSATSYGAEGRKVSTIPSGQLFAGRTEVFGNRQYGSGYPGITGRGVAGRGFPFIFWRLPWGGVAGVGTAAYLHNTEYSRFDNSSRPGGLARDSNVLDPFDFKFEGIPVPKEPPELPQKPTHDKTVNVQMFSKARDVSIRDTKINNVGGDYTINHNYNVYLQPDWELLSTSNQYSNSFSNLESKISHAVETVNRFLPSLFSSAPDIALEEKVAEDALKFPPLFNVPVLLSKTSLFKDGVVNQLLSSVRYAFFCELSLP